MPKLYDYQCADRSCAKIVEAWENEIEGKACECGRREWIRQIPLPRLIGTARQKIIDRGQRHPPTQPIRVTVPRSYNNNDKKRPVSKNVLGSSNRGPTRSK